MFGQCCFNVGDVKCTMGTGTFLDVNTGKTPHASVAGEGLFLTDFVPLVLLVCFVSVVPCFVLFFGVVGCLFVGHFLVLQMFCLKVQVALCGSFIRFSVVPV